MAALKVIDLVERMAGSSAGSTAEMRTVLTAVLTAGSSDVMMVVRKAAKRDGTMAGMTGSYWVGMKVGWLA